MTTTRTIAGREVHPAAEMFPMMGEPERLELRRSIAEEGLTHPIVLDGQGRVLDGRNRLLACSLAGVEPRFTAYVGDDPIAYVVRNNLIRRHLTEGQRAILAADLLPLYQREAELRRTRALEAANAERAAVAERARARQARMVEPEPEEPETEEPEDEGEIDTGRARDLAAAAADVSGRSVARAAVVLERGAPELVEATRGGSIAVSTAADLTDLPLAEQAEVIARGEAEVLARAKAIRAARQAANRDERLTRIATIARGNRPLEVGSERYAVILADPPWRYDAPISTSREIEEHYPTMTVDEICALPVGEIATDDALLFLWATAPLLPEAIRVAEAWGFEVRTHQIWAKSGRTGMGRWLRTEHELLLWCVRGAPPVPPPSDRPHSVITAPVGEHSVKPALFAEQIEQLYGPLPRIELFTRAPREGWAAWGNQAEAAEGEEASSDA